ncbi:peptidoglycan-binding protein LysM, partial [Bradyrhizobium sp. SHOUNA76]|nr:peptidoglycan-binding protein LysM [Bradyrhizobium sp. SHOUNA76]
MMTASKAFIAFCLLALVGTVLVIGPTELRRLLPDGTKTAIAAKPEAKAEPKVEAKVDLKPEPKPEAPKPEQPKLAAATPPAPAPAA